MIKNCAISPMSISFGCNKIGLKSVGLSVKPMPNITNPSIGVTAAVPIQLKEAGKIKAIADTATTHQVMCAAI